MENDTLQRYIAGEASQQEKDNIAQWLDADGKNKQEFLLLRNLYDASVWNEASSALQVKRRTLARRFAWEFLKIAAVFLAAFGCYHFLVPAKPVTEEAIHYTNIYVPEGQRTQITLVDGTHVWLNAKTTLVFPNRFPDAAREVTLDGEAYFDVVSDASKPFIVSTEKYQIKALGTEFNVKAYPGSFFETSLIKGLVEVSSEATGEKVRLKPNQALYTDAGSLVTAQLNNYGQFLWKEGIIAFENERVEDIFKKLELYYNVRIIVKNNKIIEDRYMGKFRTRDGVEHVLKVLQIRHRFKYTRDPDSNTITIY